MSEHDTVRQSIRGKLDRVTGKPATIYTPPEDLVDPPSNVRPADPAREARYALALHAFHYQGVIHWDESAEAEREVFRSEARAVMAVVDEEQAELRAEVERQAVLLRAIEDCHRDPARTILKADQLAGGAIIRAHAAEERLDALVAGLQELLGEWADAEQCPHEAIRAVCPSPCGCRCRGCAIEDEKHEHRAAVRAVLDKHTNNTQEKP